MSFLTALENGTEKWKNSVIKRKVKGMSASLLRVMSTKTEPRLLHQVDTTTPHQKITYRQLSDKPTKDGPKVTFLLKTNVIFQCPTLRSNNPQGPKNPRV